MQIPGPAGAPDIPVRIYIPKNLQCLTSAYLNFYGGGFVFGDLDSEHARATNIQNM